MTEIIGLDITSRFVNFDLNVPKIKMMLLDATREDEVNRIEGQFDFIIDDGSHELRDAVVSFRLLRDRIRPGGAYIIEDVKSTDEADILMAMGEKMVGTSSCQTPATSRDATTT